MSHKSLIEAIQNLTQKVDMLNEASAIDSLSTFKGDINAHIAGLKGLQKSLKEIEKFFDEKFFDFFHKIQKTVKETKRDLMNKNASSSTENGATITIRGFTDDGAKTLKVLEKMEKNLKWIENSYGNGNGKDFSLYATALYPELEGYITRLKDIQKNIK